MNRFPQTKEEEASMDLVKIGHSICKNLHAGDLDQCIQILMAHAAAERYHFSEQTLSCLRKQLLA